MTTAPARTTRPSRSLMPRAMSVAGLKSSTISSATSACLINRFGWPSSTSRIFRRYCCLSHCARGDHTAGPRDVLSRRNWMPTASVTSPITPPRASTSRTRCPFAIPPTAGLQDIWAIRSTLSVKRAVFRPIRAQAIEASQPACPAPTTTTSYCSVNDICYPLFYLFGNRRAEFVTLINIFMKFARWTFLLAGIWGIIVLAPLYFLENFIGAQHPPAITHPEYFYGFVGVGLAWQILFIIVASDPVRYRGVMPAGVV